jgi:hypothetical protein
VTEYIPGKHILEQAVEVYKAELKERIAYMMEPLKGGVTEESRREMIRRAYRAYKG